LMTWRALSMSPCATASLETLMASMEIMRKDAALSK